MQIPSGIGGRVSPLTTVEERLAIGKAIRSEVPRSALSAFQSGSLRDPIAILERQSNTRLGELNPIRFGRMATSPFAFYRGAAAVMAADLAPVVRSPIHVQLCGDAHLMNFGLFASPERRLVFDINDFDETIRGPFCWDLKRLAASIVIAAQELGFTTRQQEAAVMSMCDSFRDGINSFASKRHLAVWYSHIVAEDLAAIVPMKVSTAQATMMNKVVRKARQKDAFRALRKLVVESNDQLQFREDPPLLVRMATLAGSDPLFNESEVEDVLGSYPESLDDDLRFLLSQYTIVDFARKVVGVGSVGTRCYVALLIGIDKRDPLFLQVKEAQHSVVEPYVAPSPYENQGRRVVEGLRLVQATPDIFLGWHRMTSDDGSVKDFYVRQLHDQKGSVDLELLDPKMLNAYSRVCGWALARAQARSGYRFVLSGYLGKGSAFPEAMTEFAFAYAEQNKSDHAALTRAISSGRVRATSDL